MWLADDGLKEIGCTAQIAEVLERHGGRPDEHPRARRRSPFRLLERQEDHVYPAGTIELLEDRAPTSVEDEVGDEARERYADLLEQHHRRAARGRPRSPS